MTLRNSRANTCKILGLVDEGILDANTVMLAALNWLSDDDVMQMAWANDFFYNDEEEDLEEEEEELNEEKE